jgi:hypothetical protein
MNRGFFHPFFACLAIGSACWAACGGGSGDSESGAGAGGSASQGTGGEGAGSGAGGAPGPLCTEPTEVPCSDDVYLDMNLQEDPAPGLITSAPDGTGFQTNIDATAGGAFTPTPHSYVYGKFTDQGLEKVVLGDEDSLLSMDWDIAFRRYVVRINSGHSGPSCVQASATAADTVYEELTAVPDTVLFRRDEYFTDSCDLIPDGSSLPGSPATALSGYWTYPGCVSMTNKVYVIQLADGRFVKFTVDAFYTPAAQQQCDTTGSVPMADNGSGNFIVRWAFLP